MGTGPSPDRTKTMKKLTISQLESSFVNHPNDWLWSVDQTASEFNLHSFYECDDEERIIFESWLAGYAVAENKREGFHISFSWVANGGQDTYKSAHDFTIEIDENTDFEIAGFSFVDGDGDDLTPSDLRSELAELLDIREWCNQVLDLLPTAECEENDKGEEMKEFEIVRDKEQNIKFRGELIASCSSSDNNAAGSNYSGSTGRWTELRLYKTAGGKYICSSIGRTRWQGERDRFSGCVCETIDDVIAFFGNGWLAKDLYEEADIDASIIIE